jgi:tRNA threonylcarbamoyladenosine biosynthesis protein TsaB
MQALSEEAVSSPAQVKLPGDGWTGAGSGWDNYSERLLAVLDGAVDGWNGNQYPCAGAVAQLAAPRVAAGDTVSAEQALPLYVRNDVAKKQVLASKETE